MYTQQYVRQNSVLTFNIISIYIERPQIICKEKYKLMVFRYGRVLGDTLVYAAGEDI